MTAVLYSPWPGAQEGRIPVHDGVVTYHLGMRELPSSLRPRERLLANGAEALANDELVAILFRTGTPHASALELARSVLSGFGDLIGLNQTSAQELAGEPGVGIAKASTVKAALELGKRLMTLIPDEGAQVSGPEDIYRLLHGDMSFQEQENVRVLLLNTRNRVQGIVSTSVGSLNSSAIRIAELFREPVRRQAAAVVLVHNHPSGDPTPSADDVAVTRKAVEAGKLLDIEVLDHVVIGQPRGDRPGWVSLRERGLGFDGS